MALNLWKISGKPTSYNPLPSGLNNYVTTNGISDYIIKLKAKSETGAMLRFRKYTNGVSNGFADFTLTNELKDYTYEFFGDRVAIIDQFGIGNVIIESIELIEKPLPKLTINGIDGFLSGKWNLHANAKVIDDETLELNATGDYQHSKLIIPSLVGVQYTFFQEGEGTVEVYQNNVARISASTPNTSRTFTSNYENIELRFNNATGRGKFTFKRPMLNLGSIPAPYEPKRGERMVLPTPKKNLVPNVDLKAHDLYYRYFDMDFDSGEYFSISSSHDLAVIVRRLSDNNNVINGVPLPQTFSVPTKNSYRIFLRKNGNVVNWDYSNNPLDIELQLEKGTVATPYEPYAVQLNPKPKRYVPKKNLFDKTKITPLMYVSVDTGNLVSSSVKSASDFIEIKPNFSYFRSESDTIAFYDSNKNFISSIGAGVSFGFVTPSNAKFARMTMRYPDTFQLEEGSTATPYEPYQLVLPKAQNGLQMDGASNYLQLPSMTMDSIEIDCLIDSVQPKQYHYLLDARTGLALGFVVNDIGSGGQGVGNGWTRYFINGVEKTTRKFEEIPKNQRVYLKFSTNQFTDDVAVFTNNSNTWHLKGILYGVKCYLNGQVIAEYDFTNPNNIIGDKILQNAKNLIPSFEDSRWNLHANFKVLGKDVGRLDATAGSQLSEIELPVFPSKTYKIKLPFLNYSAGQRVYIYYDGVFKYSVGASGELDFTTETNTQKVKLSLFSNATGSFDFIKPQLYELDGKEGTLYGNPVPLKKSASRMLYNKR